MAVDFSKSKTRENLMRAFAGESQARNRYTIAAKQASRDNLYSISQIFLFTADQERAHAEVFYELLRGQTEQTIETLWRVSSKSCRKCDRSSEKCSA